MARGKGRLMFNGDIYFPRRGRAPEVPEGYMADDGDPFLLHKIQRPCKLRTAVIKSVPCCGAKKYTYFCSIDNFVTNHIRCGRCTEAVI